MRRVQSKRSVRTYVWPSRASPAGVPRCLRSVGGDGADRDGGRDHGRSSPSRSDTDDGGAHGYARSAGGHRDGDSAHGCRYAGARVKRCRDGTRHSGDHRGHAASDRSCPTDPDHNRSSAADVIRAPRAAASRRRRHANRYAGGRSRGDVHADKHPDTPTNACGNSDLDPGASPDLECAPRPACSGGHRHADGSGDSHRHRTPAGDAEGSSRDAHTHPSTHVKPARCPTAARVDQHADTDRDGCPTAGHGHRRPVADRYRHCQPDTRLGRSPGCTDLCSAASAAWIALAAGG